MQWAEGLFSRTKDLLSRAEETQAEFVKTDLDLALTIARNAVSAAKGSDRRERNAEIASRAYGTLTGFIPKLVIGNYDRECIDEKMSDLRELLAQLENES